MASAHLAAENRPRNADVTPNGRYYAAFYAKLLNMPPASDGLRWLPEKHFVVLLRIPRSTYYSWEKEGLLTRPPSGAYRETEVVEGAIVAAIRPRISLAATRNAMQRLRETDVLAEITDRFRDPSVDERLDLVIDLEIGDVTLCSSDEALLRAARDPYLTRTLCVVPLAPTLRRAMSGFHNNAQARPTPARRGRGRPRRTPEQSGAVARLPETS